MWRPWKIVALAVGIALLTSTLVAMGTRSGQTGASLGGVHWKGGPRASGQAGLPAARRTGRPDGRTTVNPRSGFTHPGVLVSTAQLDFVGDQVDRGRQPWAGAFKAMASSPYASLDWRPKPRPIVECGPVSVPDLGCSDERADATAAYTHALLWYLTADIAHARKAVEVLDAWSGVLRQHTNSNAQLQAAWSGASFARAAELMRYTFDGWSSARVSRAKTMFRTVYLPQVANGAPSSGGNWELIVLDAAVNIAVFLDDRPLFDGTLERTRARVPAFIYLSGDGPQPKLPPGGLGSRSDLVTLWYGQQSFASGLAQETCRDFGHTGWGLTAIAHIAETAWLQGVDLYAEVRQRLIRALEFHIKYELGADVPSWLCGGRLRLGLHPIPEVAYHHYVGRLGASLPALARFIKPQRPEPANFFYGWETLTHATNELPPARRPR